MESATTRKSRKKTLRKPKFQADLAPADDRILRLLKQELQLNSNSDFMTEAIALFQWAVAERRRGHRIVSEDTTGKKHVLLLPRLERVAPESMLPYVDIDWSEKELQTLREISRAEPAEPTELLKRAMRG